MLSPSTHEAELFALKYFSAGCILASILLLFPGSAESQNEYRNVSIGVSAGKGYAVDLSFGRREQATDGHDRGWDLAASVWTPEYRLPILNDHTPAAEANDFYEGAYIEETKDVTFGFGVGVRYVFRPVAIGGMFDVVLDRHIDFYRNPIENSRVQLREDMTLGGWTGTVTINAIDRVSVNAFYGTKRGLNVGAAWNIVNP
ncbi:MAG TPA: hypothetical protein VL633_11430 [Bacteroidota bacterium]|nr:hypothetical protein [Bacteroidota bacterium]